MKHAGGWLVAGALVGAVVIGGCGRDDSALTTQVDSLGSQLRATQGTLDAQRQRADDAEARAAAAEKKADDLNAQLGAARQQLAEFDTTTVSTAPRPPPTTAVVIRLTDNATLVQALDAACHASAGARAQDGAYAPFAAYFHQLEIQQQQFAAQGQPSYKPDPAGQAAKWAGSQANACY